MKGALVFSDSVSSAWTLYNARSSVSIINSNAYAGTSAIQLTTSPTETYGCITDTNIISIIIYYS